jgi:hypothetical protein
MTKKWLLDEEEFAGIKKHPRQISDGESAVQGSDGFVPF